MAKTNLNRVSTQDRPAAIRTELVQGGGVPGGHYVIAADQPGRKPFITPMAECASIPLRESDVVVDIGAYVGTYAIRCARFPVKQVIAYEPTPQTFEILSRTQLPNMKLVNAAVTGDDRKTVDLYLSQGIGVTNSTVLSNRKQYVVTVPAVSYVDAVKGASIVKIDVEGGEYDFPIVQPSIRALIIDFHQTPGDWVGRAEAMIATIEAAGFRPVITPNFDQGWLRAGSWIRDIPTEGGFMPMLQGQVCCGCGAALVQEGVKALCPACWNSWLVKHRVGFKRGRIEGGKQMTDRPAKQSKQKQPAPADIFRSRIIPGSLSSKPADQFAVHPLNAKYHPEFQRLALKGALKQVGFVAPVIESKRSGYLLDGHDRVWIADETKSEVPYVVVDVTEEEEAFILATLDPIGWLSGHDKDLFANLMEHVETSNVDLQKMLADAGAAAGLLGGNGSGEDPYTRKIEAPIYEPSDQKPAVAELFDHSKTAALVQQIAAADIPEDVREFLVIAAQRHTVLNFSKIADFYAHAPAEVQRLMEASALVIIDFDQAIELGFVQLSKNIAGLVADEYGD